MPTVKLVDENTTDPRIKAVFDDIKATKKIAHIPNIWRALASHPEHLELCWTHVFEPEVVHYDIFRKRLAKWLFRMSEGN